MILSNGGIPGHKRRGAYTTSEFRCPRDLRKRGGSERSLPVNGKIPPHPTDFRPQDHSILADLRLRQNLPNRIDKPFTENFFHTLKGHLQQSRYET